MQGGKYKGKEKEERKRKEKILMTQERAKKTGERITRGEPPIPRLVKQRATKGSQELVIRTIHVLKSPPVSLPPKAPH